LVWYSGCGSRISNMKGIMMAKKPGIYSLYPIYDIFSCSLQLLEKMATHTLRKNLLHKKRQTSIISISALALILIDSDKKSLTLFYTPHGRITMH
jgi:hypothetical protein